MTDPSFKIVPVAGGKIEQIRTAGKAQLSSEEYEELDDLLLQLQYQGVTPYRNAALGKLMAKIDWQLEISESPEWSQALIECDRAFLGNEIRDMFVELGLDPPRGHKKQLCRQLYMLGHPKVVAIMEPYIEGGEK